MVPNRGTMLRSAILPSALLMSTVTMACGGKDATRPAGNSVEITEAAPLTNCDAEAALAEKELIKSGDFDVAASGWQTSVDKSPHSILSSCPQDSNYDCCLFADAEPGIETDLEATYKCATPDAPTCKGFLGSVAPQTIPAGQELACSGGGGAHGGALHMRAARLTDWGAQLYYSFQTPKDASNFDGVSFWVKRGKGGSGVQPVGRTLFVVFDDKFTKENQPKFAYERDPVTLEYVLVEDPNTGLMVPNPLIDEDGKPVIVPTVATQDLPPEQQTQANTCYDIAIDTMKCDRFGAGVGLEPEWRFVKIPFDSMKQRGYGVKSPAGRLLKEELLAFGVYLDVGNWDVWIDQVAFYKDPKPE